MLHELYDEHPALRGRRVTTTGYGEDLAKNAFHADYGVVETVAHFTAARHFLPNVDFIIDIGGQDMKCFKIEDGAISNIFLNEACSSGCGSFLQTFAQALGYDVKEFAQLGLFAERPVDLGSRCTVFMNSSVKQAQKDGATIENISAGLSISVVKNAIYKVIRASSPEELGRNIVVQGGTFYNEAVLRAFEKEMGVEVIRPDIAGLMGAYGAALFGRGKARADQTSTLLDRQELADFRQETESRVCGLCGNNCQLTINTFADGATFISGNRCDRPVTGKADTGERNLYAYKRKLILGYKPRPRQPGQDRAAPVPEHVGAAALLAYVLYQAGLYGRITAPCPAGTCISEGQGTIPSDTACFPAKLAHGHIHDPGQAGRGRHLLPLHDAIIWMKAWATTTTTARWWPTIPRCSRATARSCAEHHASSMTTWAFTAARTLPGSFPAMLRQILPRHPARRGAEATTPPTPSTPTTCPWSRKEGERIIDQARAEGRHIIVLAGRPYHVDPEVNHGIDTLIIRQPARRSSRRTPSPTGWRNSPPRC